MENTPYIWNPNENDQCDQCLKSEAFLPLIIEQPRKTTGAILATHVMLNLMEHADATEVLVRITQANVKKNGSMHGYTADALGSNVCFIFCEKQFHNNAYLSRARRALS